MLVGCAISALAVLMLVNQLQQVENGPDKLWQALREAQKLPMAVLVLGVLGSLVARAVRWQVLFLPEQRVPLGPLFGTLAISYMASTFLPLRAGELVRAVFLGHRAQVAVPRVVGTIMLEKLFDFLAIGVMLVVLLFALPSLPVLATVAGATIAIAILGGFGFVVALAIWREPTLALVRQVGDHLPFGLDQRFKLEHAAAEFARGTDSLRQPRLWVRLLIWTTIAWLCSVVSTWAGFAALNLQAGLAAMIFVIVVTSASQAVPSSPGYIGVYHAAVTTALLPFGVDQPSALAFALISHAFSYGSLVIVGLLALWTGGYSLSDVVGATGSQQRVRIAATDPATSDA